MTMTESKKYLLTELKGHKMFRKILMVMCLLLVAGGLGCAALSHVVTPAPVNEKAIEYVVDARVADANEFAGYANLDKAFRLQQAVERAHEVNVQELQQYMENENLHYSHMSGATKQDVDTGVAREEILFGPKGLATLGLTMAGFGGFTGLLGLMRKRPGDITRDEFQNAVNTLATENIQDVEVSEKHLRDVVKGVGKFMETYPDTPIIKEFKDILDGTQDSDTKVAVQIIKKNL
jgi:hypothetical protein